MPRYFAKISKDDLRNKVNAIGNCYNLIEKLGRDIKVNFDLENFDWGEAEGLMGLQTLDNGLTFWGMCAGGDWEQPVFFIVYWDGKKLRGYVPTDGNTWNTTTKQAYGNDEAADIKDVKKRWRKLFPGDDLDDLTPDDLEYKPDFIEKDIVERILPK